MTLVQRSPDLRVFLLPAPSPVSRVATAGFVAAYSCGAVTDSHRLPRAALPAAPCTSEPYSIDSGTIPHRERLVKGYVYLILNGAAPRGEYNFTCHSLPIPMLSSPASALKSDPARPVKKQECPRNLIVGIVNPPLWGQVQLSPQPPISPRRLPSRARDPRRRGARPIPLPSAPALRPPLRRRLPGDTAPP